MKLQSEPNIKKNTRNLVSMNNNWICKLLVTCAWTKHDPTQLNKNKCPVHLRVHLGEVWIETTGGYNWKLVPLLQSLSLFMGATNKSFRCLQSAHSVNTTPYTRLTQYTETTCLLNTDLNYRHVYIYTMDTSNYKWRYLYWHGS